MPREAGWLTSEQLGCCVGWLVIAGVTLVFMHANK